MKVGDLVTLSAASLKRDTLWQWSPIAGATQKPKPIGMVVEVFMGKIGYLDISKKQKEVFRVKWITADAPKGRDGNYGWMNTEFKGLFYRRDLKYVSKRKVKKA